MNGNSLELKRKDGYIMIDILLSSDSTIRVLFEMEAALVCAHPRVRADVRKLAIVKGPLVYCLEEADNGKNLGALMISAKTALKAEYDPTLLNGTMTITAGLGLGIYWSRGQAKKTAVAADCPGMRRNPGDLRDCKGRGA